MMKGIVLENLLESVLSRILISRFRRDYGFHLKVEVLKFVLCYSMKDFQISVLLVDGLGILCEIVFILLLTKMSSGSGHGSKLLVCFWGKVWIC